jgi:hypothetical protein
MNIHMYDVYHVIRGKWVNGRSIHLSYDQAVADQAMLARRGRKAVIVDAGQVPAVPVS